MLYLDLYILNAAGCLQDAALLAAVAALQDTVLPAVRITDEGNVERGGSGGSDSSDDVQQPAAAAGSQQQVARGAPLVLQSQPLSLTCGLYKGRLVADPDHEEEALMGASISVIVDEQQRLLGAHLRVWAFV